MTQASIQKTILVIGGTGAGKSSFINNLALIHRFPTLQEAEKGAPDFQLPIPVCTEFKNVQIAYGEDENERRDEACSRTRKPQIYCFKSGNVTIKLIDTPGMTDSEGQIDDEHVKNITACMYQCKEIHGILALLKSSENTLNQSLKYTLNMVLSCLGKSAAYMVSFGITHSNHNKNPGAAPKVLRRFLEEMSDNPGIKFAADNTYCFESSPLFHILSTQNGSYECDEVDRLFYICAYNSNGKEMRRFFTSVFRCQESYNILNVPTLTVAKQMQPALATLLPYVDSKDDEIKRELDSLEEELHFQDSQYSQQGPKLNREHRKQIQKIMSTITGETRGECFEAAKNTFNAAFVRYEAGGSKLDSASEILSAVSWVLRGLCAKPKIFQFAKPEYILEVEVDPVVKRLLENINKEKTKIKQKQSEKSTLYEKFLMEKKMLLDLLCDLISYLEEHAIVAYSNTGHGFSEDTARGLSARIKKLEISGQWNATSKIIKADDLISRLSAMQDLEHFGNKIKKILLQCENFENIEFRVVDIRSETNSILF